MRLASIMLACVVSACATGEPGPDQGMASRPGRYDRDRIDSYIQDIERIPSEPPRVIEKGTEEADSPPGYKCTKTHLEETQRYDELVAYGANSETLWPGALVHGNSINDGLLTQAVLPRRPMTVSVSLQNIDGAKSTRIDRPSLASYREGISDILISDVEGETKANLTFETFRVHSEEQLKLHLGAHFSGFGVSIRSSYDFDNEDIRSRFLVRFTQAYYTVDLDPPSRPSGFFTDDVTLEDVKGTFHEDDPPTYVSSVTYGRQIFFTVESELSARETKAALEASFGGWGVSAGFEVEHETRRLFERSQMRAWIVGGSASDAAETIGGQEEMIDLIEDGAEYSEDSPGAPIAYKLAYVADNEITRLSSTSDYSITECGRITDEVAVTLKSIRVRKMTEHNGDDVYGIVTAQGQSLPVVLFDKKKYERREVYAGEKWTVNKTEIIPVTPKPGHAVTLHAVMRDDDRLIGDEERVLHFTEGWAYDDYVMEVGTKDSIWELSFRLRPL